MSAKSKYLDSRLLKPMRISDCTEVESLCNFFMQVIQSEHPKMRKIPETRENLLMVLANLFYADLLEVDPYIAYHRNSNRFSPGYRFYKMGLSRTRLIRITDMLDSRGYTSGSKGYKFEDSGYGVITRMRATEKLCGLFDRCGWRASMIASERPKPSVILRDDDKKEITFEETEESNRMRRVADGINDFLSTVEIRINNKLQPVDYYQRKFNRRSFDLGGRWYGHWILGLKNRGHQTRHGSTRKTLVESGLLTLNGEAVVELDYHAMHLVMMYHLHDLQPLFSNGYDLGGSGFDKRHIPLVKLATMCLVNNNSIPAARRALQAEINKGNLANFRNTNLNLLFDAITQRHSRVSDMFLRELGLGMQKKDSDIAERIMWHFTQRQVPCLCLHDSFIVPRRFEQELHDLMVTKYQEVIGCGVPMIH